MRAIIQRVSECRVTVGNRVVGAIDSGILIFLGIGQGDKREDAEYLVDKIINLRIFEDDEGKMNLSALNLEKEIMVVSQFTLYGDCRQGRRPSFGGAAAPDTAEELYDYFVEKIDESNLRVATGTFQEMMDVDLINDGPVTFLLDSNKQF